MSLAGYLLCGGYGESSLYAFTKTNQLIFFYSYRVSCAYAFVATVLLTLVLILTLLLALIHTLLTKYSYLKN